jgi:hypothetical protein
MDFSTGLVFLLTGLEKSKHRKRQPPELRLCQKMSDYRPGNCKGA